MKQIGFVLSLLLLLSSHAFATETEQPINTKLTAREQPLTQPMLSPDQSATPGQQNLPMEAHEDPSKKYRTVAGLKPAKDFMKRMREATLKVKITNFLKLNGNVMVWVFDQKNGFPWNPAKAAFTVTAPVEDTTVVVTFPNMDFGRYAIVAVHDYNSNGMLDINWRRAPAEWYGIYNPKTHFLSFGGFSDSCFEFNTNNQEITIKLKKP